MAEGNIAEFKRIPTHWKKITKPEHIRPSHILPAFNHPPDTRPIWWDFPPQHSNLTDLHPA